MYVLLPDAVTGGCPGLTAPVFRLWNDPSSHGRTDNNHRFTTDTVTWQQMVTMGSVAEGYGAQGRRHVRAHTPAAILTPHAPDPALRRFPRQLGGRPGANHCLFTGWCHASGRAPR